MPVNETKITEKASGTAQVPGHPATQEAIAVQGIRKMYPGRGESNAC